MSFFMSIFELIKGSLTLLGQLAAIFIVIMIIVEFLQEYNILSKLTNITAPITKILGIPPEGNLPLIAGMFLGISYGAGIIIETAHEGSLSLEDVYLINMFLVICHGLVEDTLVWSTIGAKIIPVQIGRLLLALLLSYIYARFLKKVSREQLS